jgi:hypothetical protein
MFYLKKQNYHFNEIHIFLWKNCVVKVIRNAENIVTIL